MASDNEEEKKAPGKAGRPEMTPEQEAEIVTIRVRARTLLPKPRLIRDAVRSGGAETRRVWIPGAWRTIPIVPYRRRQLRGST